MPSADQRRVIELPGSARAFVIAGPGAGKTWTLLERARRLTEREEAAPSSLLVLSFTRAVVRELRKRDREANAVSTVFPETFDSFAGRLLRTHATDESWQSRGYDGRIVAATELLRSGACAETLDRVVHVLVDEVQDLVAPRSGFVAALLDAHGGGFTAFGDPAQAIYDHERAADEVSFIDRLRAGLADEELCLEGNRRASGPLAQTAAEVRRVLLAGDLPQSVQATTDAFLGLPAAGLFTDVPAMATMLPHGSAVLCRDNATALLLSRALHAEGVRHRVRRGSVDRPVAGWVAAVFAGSTRLGRTQFERRWSELADLGFPGLPDPDLGWRLLCRLDPGARGGAVRATEVGSRIALGRVPYELSDEPDCDLVVSSVHRAKGLEFSVCAVVDWRGRDEADAALESRVRFVALSRARKDCFHAEPRARWPIWVRRSEAHGRFIKLGKKPSQTFGVELYGDDVHATQPAGTVGFEDDVAAVQHRLTAQVRPGDAIELLLAGRFDFGFGERPSYVVRHDAGPIGVTGERFGDALRGRLRGSVPQRITELRVDDLETVKGPIESGDAAGLGRAGLWLRPRLVGLGEFEWGRST